MTECIKINHAHTIILVLEYGAYKKLPIVVLGALLFIGLHLFAVEVFSQVLVLVCQIQDVNSYSPDVLSTHIENMSYQHPLLSLSSLDA